MAGNPSRLERLRKCILLTLVAASLAHLSLRHLLCFRQIYTLEGQVLLGPSESATPLRPVDAFYTSVLSSATGESGIAVESVSDKARLVIVAGEPLDQEVRCSCHLSRSQA